MLYLSTEYLVKCLIMGKTPDELISNFTENLIEAKAIYQKIKPEVPNCFGSVLTKYVDSKLDLDIMLNSIETENLVSRRQELIDFYLEKLYTQIAKTEEAAF